MTVPGQANPKDPEVLHAWRFSPWKKPIVQRFFPASKIVFVARGEQVPKGATLAVWGMTQPEVDPSVAIWRLEDGFLRSVGLGADLVQPLSWVVDRQGLYFDCAQPSDLELRLEQGTCDPAQRHRAQALRQRLVSSALTKYNVAGQPWRRPKGRTSVVLVPGQVESDASIRHGSPQLRRNVDLLAAVRAARPASYLVYKPHPDVVAGLRATGDDEQRAAHRCDEVLTDARMDQLLDQVDEVHTLTSLTGFEALLRGKPVTCWGQPFYAGWGLTEDRVPIERRTRRLSLDELVASALIDYPRYVRRTDGSPGTAETAVDDLLAWRVQGAGAPTLWQRALRPVWGLRAS
jgi:capsular polysaccharide export protein